MNPMSEKRLHEDNVREAGSGGRSQDNRGLGLRPAFLDFSTQAIYPSRFSDGRPAPIHSLDGLPDELVVESSAQGRVLSAKPTVIAGFERNGLFYTRSATALCGEGVVASLKRSARDPSITKPWPS
jgi:hypothetical protein